MNSRPLQCPACGAVAKLGTGPVLYRNCDDCEQRQATADMAARQLLTIWGTPKESHDLFTLRNHKT